jgi:hypothetical protein
LQRSLRATRNALAAAVTTLTVDANDLSMHCTELMARRAAYAHDGRHVLPSQGLFRHLAPIQGSGSLRTFFVVTARKVGAPLNANFAAGNLASRPNHSALLVQLNAYRGLWPLRTRSEPASECFLHFASRSTTHLSHSGDGKGPCERTHLPESSLFQIS